MTENFVRHLVAFIGTLCAALIYLAGYIGGSHGWWWAIISVAGVYAIVYKLITAGGGHH